MFKRILKSSLMIVAAFVFSSAAQAATPLKVYGERQAGEQPVLDTLHVNLMSQPNASLRYDCYVANPGERDRIGRYCRSGYPIMYDGYIVDNLCHGTTTSAYDKMESLSVCRTYAPYQVGRCRIVQPNEKDLANRYCKLSYGVDYYGYLVNSSCNTNIQDAVNKMQGINACFERDSYGACRLAYPEQKDASNRYCRSTYGVMYRGQIMNNRCYQDLDMAINEMKNSPVCRR